MKIKFAINQAAAFRAGVNVPISPVELDIDPASLSPSERHLIGSRMKPDNRVPVMADGPTILDLLAAIAREDAAIEIERQRRADAAAAAAAERAAQIATTESAILDGSYTYGFWLAANDTVESRSLRRDGPGYESDNISALSPAAQTIIERAKAEYLAGCLRDRAAEAAQRAAALQARLYRFAPFMSSAEVALQARGKLDLDSVEQRLKDEACAALADRAANPFTGVARPRNYCGPSSVEAGHHCASPADTWSVDWLAAVRDIESLTDHPVSAVVVGPRRLKLDTAITVPWQPDLLPVCIIIDATNDDPDIDPDIDPDDDWD